MTLINLRLIFDPLFRFAEANAKVVLPGNGNQSNVLSLPLKNLLKRSMLLLVVLFIFTSVALMAQSPQKINFQSIVRNTSGVIFSNKTLGFKISILSGSITGTQVYSESHSSMTDAIGLVSLQIGSGTALSGAFATINWGNASHFIKLEADFNGGNNYVLLGTQELMSVPYAMYAAKTDTATLNLTNRFADKAPVNNPTFTGTVGGITKAMVDGLENVENTSDEDKPVSSATQTALAAIYSAAQDTLTAIYSATQTALAAKAPKNNPEFTGQVYGIDKGMVGLGNVDNTSDASKPVSTANQTALGLKAPLANPTFTGTVGGITKTMVGLNNVDNTTDAGKPVSTATQTAIATKVNISDTMTMLSKYLRKSDFPSGSNANEILYWNGDNWVSLAPGTTGQSIIMSSKGLSWGCIVTNTAATPSSNPTLLVNTALTNITIATTGATGIDTTDSDLPNGVTAVWSGNVITISGTPTAADTFNYTISLTGGCGSVNATGTITVTAAPAATVPDAPTGVVATAGDGSASVAFVVPNNDGGSVITRYFVTSDPITFESGAVDDRKGPTSPISVSQLMNGTAYTFTVVARNEIGLSVASAPSAAVTPAPPSACPTTTVEDSDGNEYNTVGIGTQCWMKENLKVTKYNNGDDIPDGTAASGWGALTSGARAEYVADGVTDYVGTYGYLYNWYAATDSRKICPKGWHVPTDAEWTTLTTYLGDNPCTQMKKEDALLWSTNTGTNSSGFSALPGGSRSIDGSFVSIKDAAIFWSATESDIDYAWRRVLLNNYDGVLRLNSFEKSLGASVRCLRDY